MNEEDVIRNVAIYVRVSTEEQAKEGYSIRAQIEKLKNYIGIMGWTLYNVYMDDGISGKNITDRPAINNMLRDVIEKKVNTVLVFKVDRLTRSTRDLIDLVEVFNQNDCAFISIMESIDTKTASGRMFLKIIGIFAEFERENIIERVKVGFERKAREGYTLCSATPSYGYDRKIGEKIQTINKEEAEMVRYIFDQYINSNRSMTNIAQELNIKSVKTKQNSIWSTKTIKLVLTNPNYIGKVRYSIQDKSRYFEADGHHELIISEDIYNKAQLKISKLKTSVRTKRPREDNYFTGVLYCGICGRKHSTHGTYRTKKNGETHYIGQYRCVNKMLKLCSSKDVSHIKVAEAFEEYINNIQDLENADKSIIDKIAEETTDGLSQDYYATALNKLEKKEKEIMDFYVLEKIGFEDYSKMMKIVNNKKTELVAELKKLEKIEKEDVSITKEDIILNVKENWALLTNPERAQFLQTYIKKIVVINEKQENTHYGKVKIKSVEFYSE